MSRQVKLIENTQKLRINTPIRDPVQANENGTPPPPPQPTRVYGGQDCVVVWMAAEHPLAQRWIDDQNKVFTVDQWRTFRVRGLLGNIEEHRRDGTWKPVTATLQEAGEDDQRPASSRRGLAATLTHMTNGLHSKLTRGPERTKR